MFKAGARLGCGVAAAAVVGIHGKTQEPGASHSLMQGASMSSIAVGSTSKYHEQSARLFDELEKLAAQGKDLPASILTFIEGIKGAAADIIKKLEHEHKAQKAALIESFGAFATCATALKTTVASIEGDGKQSAKAASAKVALCTCRKAQVVANFDCEGCEIELECWTKDVATKKAAESGFLRKNGDPVPQYVDDSGTDMCAALSISSSSSDSEDKQAKAWFEKQIVDSNDHWAERKSSLQALVDAHETAKKTREALENGTAPYAVKGGCVALCKIKSDKKKECTAAQSSATVLQCTYYTTKKAACDNYKQCYIKAKKDWDEDKTRETKDSQDRKHGWATAKKIECLAGSFSTNKKGNVEINKVASEKCSLIKCDAACTKALDLNEILNQPIPQEESCSTPPQPCKGWEPSCNGVETGSWGKHTPLYSVDARKDSQCGTVKADELGLAKGQVMETCQECGGR